METVAKGLFERLTQTCFLRDYSESSEKYLRKIMLKELFEKIDVKNGVKNGVKNIPF